MCSTLGSKWKWVKSRLIMNMCSSNLLTINTSEISQCMKIRDEGDSDNSLEGTLLHFSVGFDTIIMMIIVCYYSHMMAHSPAVFSIWKSLKMHIWEEENLYWREGGKIRRQHHEHTHKIVFLSLLGIISLLQILIVILI